MGICTLQIYKTRILDKSPSIYLLSQAHWQKARLHVEQSIRDTSLAGPGLTHCTTMPAPPTLNAVLIKQKS